MRKTTVDDQEMAYNFCFLFGINMNGWIWVLLGVGAVEGFWEGGEQNISDCGERERIGREIAAVPVATAAYFKMNERD